MAVRAPAQDAGGALIEVVVALAILGGVAGAVAVARRPDPDRARLHEAAELLASALRQARSLAMTSGSPAGVRLQLGSNQYVMLPAGKVRQLPPQQLLSVATSDDGVLRMGAVDVAFSPLGLSIGAVIHIESGAHVQRVQVEPLSGRVAIVR